MSQYDRQQAMIANRQTKVAVLLRYGDGHASELYYADVHAALVMAGMLRDKGLVSSARVHWLNKDATLGQLVPHPSNKDFKE